ncbi:CcmD family protein [bacterium]|nr:CcmD family protein [bacterium]NUN44701.1 CcmD family protein [bacterium]HMV25892.1 CcmD family protein [bacterium]HMW34392.1 CcmD family protein [bacterium]HMW36665.1 CcmD family protein [bacterium]
MENLGYLFAAFAAIWVLLFYYVQRMNSKQKQMMKDLEALRQIVEEKKG